MKTKKQTAVNPTDSFIGKRLHLRRKLLKMSQKELADEMSVSLKELQTFEHGTVRIGATRLFELATILDVPVAYFFEGIAYEKNTIIPVLSNADDEDLLGVMSTYAKHSNPHFKRNLHTLLTTLAKDEYSRSLERLSLAVRK